MTVVTESPEATSELPVVPEPVPEPESNEPETSQNITLPSRGMASSDTVILPDGSSPQPEPTPLPQPPSNQAKESVSTVPQSVPEQVPEENFNNITENMNQVRSQNLCPGIRKILDITQLYNRC